MHAALLFLELGEAPTPTVGLAPVYTVHALGRRLPYAVVTSIDYQLTAVAGFEIGCPQVISEEGREIPNPGMVGMFEGGEVTVYRDGKIVASGFCDAPEIDSEAKWVKLTCKDHVEDINRTAVGTGLNEWNNNDPDDPDVPDPVDPLLTGWSSFNATLSAVDSPWGMGAIAVGLGPEKKAAWHFAFYAITLGPNQKLDLSARISYAPKTAHKRIITIRKTLMDRPNKYYITTCSIPPEAPEVRWSKEFELPTLTGSEGVATLYNIACWSPTGQGSHRFAIRGKLTTETPIDEDADPEVPQVKVGGDSAEMVVRLMKASAARSGGNWFAVSRGGGVVFEDGMKIEPGDTGYHGSHISTWEPTIEWRWIPWARTVEVAGKGDLGRTWSEIRVGKVGRNVVVGIKGASKGMARWITVTGRDDERTYAFTHDTGAGRGWDRIISAPADTNFQAFANAAVAEAQLPGLPLEVNLGPPAGQRTPGDWLALGLQVGDRIPVDVDAGPWSQSGNLRVTSMQLQPQAGDALKVTLEPVP